VCYTFWCSYFFTGAGGGGGIFGLLGTIDLVDGGALEGPGCLGMYSTPYEKFRDKKSSISLLTMFFHRLTSGQRASLCPFSMAISFCLSS
jgi:hypothetical protein